ncbi:hypothetical protein AVEN_247955-1 [Araneus ventricosus]|uniref:Uncharacterized protein n=1 Tax=Araneus ventricosus TaxID=182803 RepID=A0A4Y2CJG8_ARAVE|nr:hypothetical protein AVEN_247955-1 [Araneus ventricosus]
MTDIGRRESVLIPRLPITPKDLSSQFKRVHAIPPPGKSLGSREIPLVTGLACEGGRPASSRERSVLVRSAFRSGALVSLGSGRLEVTLGVDIAASNRAAMLKYGERVAARGECVSSPVCQSDLAASRYEFYELRTHIKEKIVASPVSHCLTLHHVMLDLPTPKCEFYGLSTHIKGKSVESPVSHCFTLHHVMLDLATPSPMS